MIADGGHIRSLVRKKVSDFFRSSQPSLEKLDPFLSIVQSAVAAEKGEYQPA
jgi:hypothetical protein